MAAKTGCGPTRNTWRSTRGSWSGTWPPGGIDERLLRASPDYGTRALAGEDARLGCRHRWLGQPDCRRAAARHRQRRRASVPLHSHAAAHHPHPGPLPAGPERHLTRHGRLADARRQRERVGRRDARRADRQHHELVRERLHREPRAARALSRYRGAGTPDRVVAERRRPDAALAVGACLYAALVIPLSIHKGGDFTSELGQSERLLHGLAPFGAADPSLGVPWPPFSAVVLIPFALIARISLPVAKGLWAATSVGCIWWTARWAARRRWWPALIALG